jgi:DNA-directed RNA polymerase specialized sigma24 family protein
MSEKQFEALSMLLRLRPGPAREAARLVLVKGMRVTDAARTVGASQPSVSNAVRRCLRGLTLAEKAAGRGATRDVR